MYIRIDYVHIHVYTCMHASICSHAFFQYLFSLFPSTQHIFVTEVDSTRTSAVHDELARLLVLRFRMGQAKSEKLLQVQMYMYMGVHVHV